MTLLSSLVWLSPALFGISIASKARLLPEKTALILVGSLGGICLFTTILFAVSTVMPLTQVDIGIAVILLAGASIVLFVRDGWHTLRLVPFDRAAPFVLIASAILSAVVGGKLLVATSAGLETGIINAWGDLGWHIATITLFAEGQPFPPENPIFAGSRLTYPFLANVHSAILIKTGSSLTESVVLPAIIFMSMTLTLLYCFARDYGKSRVGAGIALMLFIFTGGTLGWLNFANDVRHSGQSLVEFLIHLPPSDYSGSGSNDKGMHVLNPILALLLPQRPFLFGMPLALSILLMLRPRASLTNVHRAIAGVFAGLLPLFHAHTVIALLPTLFGLFILAPGVHWLAFGIPAMLVGFPELLVYMQGEQAGGSFLRFGPGWMIGNENPVWFWLKNTGLLIPATVLGFFMRVPKPAKTTALAGLVLFAIANTFLFAPWAWDNYKIFIYWIIFSLPLVGFVIARALNALPSLARGPLIIIVALHMVSAGLDLWRVALPSATMWTEWDSAGIAIAEKITSVTPKGSVILTAPYHNSPVVLAGRPRYLGYPDHVWSHGGSPWERKKAVQDFYTGGNDTLTETSVDYVFIGPIERSQFNIIIRKSWKLIVREGPYELYYITRS